MRIFPLLVASSLAYTLHAQATQEQAQPTPAEQKTLDPIYAQASRESARDHEYANTTTIDAKSLQSRQATSLRDVFALDSSVSVGGATTTAQKVYIRGLEDRLYSVNIDNASQYGNLFHHQGNITIDPMMIKDISVQKGTPDAYMGASALAGSMSIRTKDARDFLRDGQKFGALVGLGGYSNQGYRTNAAAFFALKNTDALLWANWTNILGFHAGGNGGDGQWVQGSANNNKSLLFKLNQHLSDRDTLTLSYNGLNETSTAPFATNLAQKNVTLFAHTNYNHTATLGYTHNTDPSKPSSTQVRTNLYFNQRSLYLKPLSQAGANDHEEVSSKNIAFSNVGYNLSLSNQFSVLDLEYGLNYQGVFVADTAAPKDPINRAKESGHIYGGFVKSTYTPSEHFVLAAQSRYDVFNYFDKNNQTHLTQGFSPAASITYLPTSTLSFRASYAYLTRGAMPGDATLLGDGDVLIYKHLRAESIQNVELNADYSGSIFCARVAGYYSRLGNFINSYAHDHDHSEHIHTPGEPHSHGGLRQNMDSPIEVFGYEGGVGADYKGFSSYASIAQNFPTYKGYLLQDTYELGAVSGIIYNLSLGYEIARYHLRFAWLSQFTQRVKYKGYDIYNDQTGFIDKAGYSVHNLNINWEPLGEKRLSLRLSVNNIFNTFYIAQTSPFKNEAMDSLDSSVRRAMPNPGIDARFEVGYQF